ncbi:MAG: hypothetical protein ABJD11_01930 [Gemmatimonadota bacterium]
MNSTLPVFVDGRALEVQAGATVHDALAAYDGLLAARIVEGSAYVTDGRGIRLEADAHLAAGSILRVVRSSRGPAEEADDHS